MGEEDKHFLLVYGVYVYVWDSLFHLMIDVVFLFPDYGRVVYIYICVIYSI